MAATPSILPVLSKGRHRKPRHGGCFMEIASFFAGERWSDHPACTNAGLATLARAVNDCISDAGRSALAPLIPDIIGTTWGSKRFDAELTRLCCDVGIRRGDVRHRRVLAVGLVAAEDALADMLVSAFPLPSSAEIDEDRAWARRRLNCLPAFASESVTSAVEWSFYSLAAAGAPDLDEQLRALLEGGIALHQELKAMALPGAPEPAPVSEAEWQQACDLVGSVPASRR
jgi:hypothetical protein